MAENTTNKDRLKDITDSIETGIKELFQSDKYMQYLQTMSRFHKYSVNNTMLIYMQRPNATLVAGFNKWHDQFERNVRKGERGIKIIAPTPFKKRIEMEKLDPDTKMPMLDADGKVIIEEKEVKIPMYKPVTVFDVSQTDGKPLPTLASDLAGNVQNYDAFMEALRCSSPVPIAFEDIRDGADGYFHLEEERIAIREGMSEVQTVSAAIHEITHAKLHNREQERIAVAAGDEAKDAPKPKDRRTEEVEAESVSYAVCAYYGIATGENSFGYIATWSKDKDLSELRASLETINKTASGLITDIDRHYAVIMKERSLDKAEPEQPDSGTWRYYIIPDLKTWATNAEEQTPIEYFDTFAEAETQFQNLRIQAYNDEKGDLNPSGGPYARLTLGVDRADGASAADILQVRNGQNYLVDDFTRMEALKNNPVVMGMLSEVERHIGFDRVKGYEKTADGKYIPAPDVPFSEWNNTYFEILPPDYKYMLHTNPRSQSESDRSFIQAYVKNYAGLAPDAIIGVGSRETCTELVNRLNAGEISREEATAKLNCGLDLETAGEERVPEIGVEEASQEQAPDNGNMPDPAISITSMNAYGYTDGDMLPLSKERAIELFDRGITVYMLYDGNGAGMAFEPEDIQMHTGIFGVTREEWESVRDSLPAVDTGDIQKRRENSFLNNPADSYAIYQLKNGDELRDYHFEGMERLQKAGLSVERGNYELVYTDELHYPGDTYDKLNGLYQTFNINHPADFTGHSLSVSDIVALKQDGVVSCHYVDSFGFQELPSFLKQDNYLKTTEMAMEDDYGMLDGIINNGPKATVAELEQQAKSGQPISLMDLAAAVKREQNDDNSAKQVRKEKRPSVLEQLKAYENKVKAKTPVRRSAERDL
jgi:antirestriction protein ArdC